MINHKILRKICSAEKGVTLFETLIAVLLFSIVLIGFLSLMGQSLELGELSEKRAVLTNEMRRVTETMRKSVNTSGLSSITGSTAWATNSLTNAIANENVTVSFPQGTTQNPLPVQIVLSGTEKGKNVVHLIDALVTKR
jgi:Tfp pilus assembly protein PilV